MFVLCWRAERRRESDGAQRAGRPRPGRQRDDATRDDATRDDATRDDATRDGVTRDDVKRDDVAGHVSWSSELGGTSSDIRTTPSPIRRHHSSSPS